MPDALRFPELAGVVFASRRIGTELATGLTPRESAELDGFHVVKRRREWVAGRLAAKDAVFALTGERPGIVRRDDGSARAEGERELELSITHSYDWACAAATRGRSRIGIDLERLVEPDAAMIPVAFNGDEAAWIAREPWRLHQFWTAKEAVLKALGRGLSEDLRDLRATPDPAAPRDRVRVRVGGIHRDFDVLLGWSEEYVIAACAPVLE